MDVLTDVLGALELQGWVSARRELTPLWHYHFAASHDMIFHLLSSGGGYLSVEGDLTPLRIEGGGVLLGSVAKKLKLSKLKRTWPSFSTKRSRTCALSLE